MGCVLAYLAASLRRYIESTESRSCRHSPCLLMQRALRQESCSRNRQLRTSIRDVLGKQSHEYSKLGSLFRCLLSPARWSRFGHVFYTLSHTVLVYLINLWLVNANFKGTREQDHRFLITFSCACVQLLLHPWFRLLKSSKDVRPSK